jgi:hypothetical protein
MALDQAADDSSIVFEAAFRLEEVVVRADAFTPGEDGWPIIEVKAAFHTELYFLRDCAIHASAADCAGYRVTRVTLAHIDASVLPVVDAAVSAPLKLFDVPSQIEALKPTISGIVQRLQYVLALDEPNVEPAPQMH